MKQPVLVSDLIWNQDRLPSNTISVFTSSQEKLFCGDERAHFGDKAYANEHDKRTARAKGIYYGVLDKGKRRHPLSRKQQKRNLKKHLQDRRRHPPLGFAKPPDCMIVTSGIRALSLNQKVDHRNAPFSPWKEPMQPTTFISPNAYLSLDAASEIKHEYWDGAVIAMAGAEPDHNQIALNLALELGRRLRPKGCRGAVGDQRVQVGRRYVYPDVVFTCHEPHYLETRPRTLTNPDLLVEVLSASTMEQDLEMKLLAYTSLESLKEYWIVSSSQPLVMQYIRRDDLWILQGVMGLDAAVHSDHFEVNLALQDIYALVFGGP